MKRLFALFFLCTCLVMAQTAVPTSGQIDAQTWLNRALEGLMNTDGDLFVPEALMVLRRVGGLGLALVGLSIAWEALGGRVHFSFPALRVFLFWYVMAVLILNNWAGFRHMFTDTGAYLTARIDAGTLDQLGMKFDATRNQMFTPSMWDPTSYIPYYVILICIFMLSGVMNAVVNFGLIALAVGGIIGPLFVLSLPFQRFQAYAWGFIHYMIKYSLYGVVGAAVVNVFASFLIHFWDTVASRFTTAGQAQSMLGGLINITVLVLFTVFRVPTLVADLTSGAAHAGGSVAGGVSGFVARFR